MTPDKSLVDRLIEIASYVPWETFEKIEDGHIVLVDPEHDYRYDFHLRVGLHMRRPVQAIVSCHNFIRMRDGKAWAEYRLETIDPKYPERSLYRTMLPLYDRYLQSIPGQAMPLTNSSPEYWDPKRLGNLDYNSLANQQVTRAQIQAYAQQGIQQLQQAQLQGLQAVTTPVALTTSSSSPNWWSPLRWAR